MKRWLNYSLLKRDLLQTDSGLTNQYLKTHMITKLQIGCGDNILDGWLNSDYYPHSPKIIELNAIKKFRFANDTFDYIYSEHMIEHINYTHGLHMLKECCRVLKPNGKIRTVTPDLQFLIDLYTREKSDIQSRYAKWAFDEFTPGATAYADGFVINNFVRNWGHKFIYDEKTLSLSLTRAGFTDIVRYDLNDSNDSVLKNLENESRMPPGFLKLESFVLEARKA